MAVGVWVGDGLGVLDVARARLGVGVWALVRGAACVLVEAVGVVLVSAVEPVEPVADCDGRPAVGVLQDTAASASVTARARAPGASS